MNRRKFVKGAALAGGAALVGGSAWAAFDKSIVRADLADDPIAARVPGGLTGPEATILHYASLAPSGHNAQPWFVKINQPDDWVVGLDKDRLLSVVDPTNREAILSLGAFVENLCLAAGAVGRPAEAEMIPGDSPDGGLVRIRLGRGRKSGYPLDRLVRRRTVKKGFRPDSIKPADLNKIGAPLPGRVHYFDRDSDHGRCIAEGTIEAFRSQFNRPAAMAEAARWTRFSNADAEKRRDGLTPAGMEITGLAGFYVRNFMSPRDAAGKRFGQAGVDLTAKLAGQGGGWLVVTSPSETTAELIETGRRFQRLALLVRDHSLAIHPMTQMLEEKVGREAIRANHLGSIKPQFILRIGYLDKYPDPVSLRRPPVWFVRS